MQVEVSSQVIEAMLAAAEQACPGECCGLIFGDGWRVEAIEQARNVHPDSTSHFEIDPQALVNAHRDARSGGPQVMGYYHSHPNRRAEPSETDREQSARDGSVWAIIAAGRVSFWRDREDGFAPLSYSLTDG